MNRNKDSRPLCFPGSASWQEGTARRLGLQSTLRGARSAVEIETQAAMNRNKDSRPLCFDLARGASDGRNGAAVPGAFQIVPDRGGRPLTDGVAVRGAKPVAGEYGRRGRRLAVVEPLASGSRQRIGAFGRGPGSDTTRMAAVRGNATNGGGVGSVAAVSRARCAVWLGIVAGGHGTAVGPAVDPSRARSAVEIETQASMNRNKDSRPLCFLETKASMNRNKDSRPLCFPGSASWQEGTARRLGLQFDPSRARSAVEIETQAAMNRNKDSRPLCFDLARGASDGRNGAAVPGVFQIVPDRGGRPLTDGVAVRGAKPVAGEYGRRGRRLAVVEPLASGSRQRIGAFGRGPGSDTTRVAAVRGNATNGGGVGSVAAVSRAQCAVWLGIVAGGHGTAVGPASRPLRARSAVEIETQAAMNRNKDSRPLCFDLARGASDGRNGAAVPGAFQIVPDRGGRPLTDGVAVRGAKPVAGEYGRRGRRLAVVEPLASGSRQRIGAFGRGPGSDTTRMAAVRGNATNGGGVGSVAAVSRARCAVWLGIVAGGHGTAVGPAVDPSRAVGRGNRNSSRNEPKQRLPTPLFPFQSTLRAHGRPWKSKLKPQ